MKTIRSIWLWLTGGIFFFISFLVLVVSLFLLPRKITFNIARFLFNVLIKIMGIRLLVNGKENINPEKTYLIMGNHQSLFDLFVVPAAIPLCFTGVEAAYHFKIPVWGYLIRKWGLIPIERGNLKKAISSLETAKKTLISGVSLAILPEGHRTLTGNLGSFKKGPFYLAKGAKADILPFGINGLFNFHKKGNLILNPGKVTLTIGEPVLYEKIKNLSVEELRENIFNRICQLSQK
ncbi:MAG: 1-acyl-sn-glycerol-3-phosphate acyltransferase [Desulfobacula sp.]|nr:1-acyl-sn-glycerol-3-phosphate acyltransferase [Desulfobacula sp.]